MDDERTEMRTLTNPTPEALLEVLGGEYEVASVLHVGNGAGRVARLVGPEAEVELSEQGGLVVAEITSRRACVRCGRRATHLFRDKPVCATCPDRWHPADYERAERIGDPR